MCQSRGGLTFSELNLRVSELGPEELCGEQKPEGGLWRGQVGGQGRGAGSSQVSGVLEGRWSCSPSVMQVPLPGARTWPRDQERMRLVSGPRHRVESDVWGWGWGAHFYLWLLTMPCASMKLCSVYSTVSFTTSFHWRVGTWKVGVVLD